MNIQNSAVIEAAARLAAARAGRDESEAQSVTAFVRTLYKDFSPHQCGVGSTADELAAAALPLWRAAAGAAGGARARRGRQHAGKRRRDLSRPARRCAGRFLR